MITLHKLIHKQQQDKLSEPLKTNFTECICPDAHIHLFDKDGFITATAGDGGVGFGDYSILNLDEYTPGVMLEAYKKHTKWCLGCNYNILACAPTVDECIKIYKDVPGITGFGELKAYDEYKGDTHMDVPNMKNHDYWKPVFQLANDEKLPIWIHWSLVKSEDIYQFIGITQTYKHVPFVLCHCGVGRDEEYTHDMKPVDSMRATFNMCRKYANIYTDISYTGADALRDEELYISLPLDKVLVGSDLNPNCFVCKTNPETKNELYDNFMYFSSRLNMITRDNLLRIFSHSL